MRPFLLGVKSPIMNIALCVSHIAASSYGKEEPVYDQPLPIQAMEGDYVDLDQDTLEETHKYSSYNKKQETTK